MEQSPSTTRGLFHSDEDDHEESFDTNPLIVGVHGSDGQLSRALTHPFGGSVGSLTASDYIRLVNIKTAKVIGIVVVAIFLVYHGIMHLTRDITPCKGLLKSGIYKGELWQPWGCMMHSYSKSDIERCLRHESFEGRFTTIYYLGDHRASQLFNQTLHLLSDKTNFENISSWKSDAQRVRLNLSEMSIMSDSAFDILEHLRRLDDEVLLILAFSPPVRTPFEVTDYDSHLRNLTAFAEAVQTTSDLMRQRLSPIWVIEPGGYLERGLKKQFNADLQQVLFNTPSIEAWSSISSLSSLSGTKDSSNLTHKSLQDAVNMLLNYHCNDRTRFADATCCISSESASLLQKVTLILLSVCSFLFLAEWCYVVVFKNSNNRSSPGHVLLRLLINDTSSGGGRNNFTRNRNENEDKVFVFLFALAKLALILGYCYVCDRTNLLMRENKHFSPLNFWLPILYVMVVGLFFSEDAMPTRILHQEQIEETKGWMALVLLVFNMSGGSASFPIDCNASLLTGGFVFISAYQHFMDKWSNNEQYTLQRFLQVLFRLNFLSVLLCLTMGQSYQSYSMAPLLSFWLVVQYVFHILPPQIDATTANNQPIQYLLLVLKLMVLVFALSVLYISEVFFEGVFSVRLWRSLFVANSNSTRSWWLSWRLHRYTVVHAILFGLLVHLGRKTHVIDDAQNSRALFPRNMAIMVSVVSVVGLGGFALWSFYSGDLQQCYEALPYIDCLPIVAYVMLRNVAGGIRCRYSSFFAWFGPISLELMVAQNHLWMASNANGILVLLPNYPLVNLLLSSFVFVCVCHELHHLTLVLERILVPDDQRHLLRNLSIFVVMLIPLALRDWLMP